MKRISFTNTKIDAVFLAGGKGTRIKKILKGKPKPIINIKKKIDGWDVIKNEKNIHFLEKKFTFKNFVESQKFVNEVGRISEEEGHHPEILFGWGYAKINISTHAIEGLSENDFILASKIDKI